MSARDIASRLRWWWWIGLLAIGLYFSLTGSLMARASFRRWLFGGANVSMFLVLVPALFMFAWLVVIAPWLEARVATFSDRRPATRRARFCRRFAYVPLVVFTLLLVQYIVVRIARVEHFGWYTTGYGSLIVGAIVLSIVYGRIMSRQLEHQVRSAAARAGVCFSCNYRLDGLTGGRCPECGEPM